MWNDDEAIWKPDQETVYIAHFERFFKEPVVLIWPRVIRDKYGQHVCYKLNRPHMHEGEIISSTDTTLEFRWLHRNDEAEIINVKPMTDGEFSEFRRKYPVYKNMSDILRDYIEAY